VRESEAFRNTQLEPLFPGDSEMARRMRALDWSATDFGPPETWPENLRVAVSICLPCRFPIVIFWGPKLCLLYNDPYLPWLTAAKHPLVLGRPAIECWPEIWDVIVPMLEGVLATGKATWSENSELYFNRRLPREEVYITWTYAPILAADGQTVDGIFCPCTETTEQVVGARRLETLRKLGIRSLENRTVQAVCEQAVAVLGESPRDIPFAALYVVNPTGAEATMRAMVMPEAEHLLPRSVSVSGDGLLSPWPLASVFGLKSPVEIGNLESLGVRIPGRPWPELVSKAVALPIHAAPETLAGILIAGVGPRRPWDAAYRTFLDLVAGRVGVAISDALAYEQERQRAEALAEIDRAKTLFFSNVSHEFRTPLTLMLGSIEDLLAKGNGDLIPENRAVLNVAHRNALRLLKLVNTLLDFSRIEAGRIQASYQLTDLAGFTAELAGGFRSAMEKAGLRLTVDCPPLPQPVYVDRDMWEQIVLNLISNALKFTFEGEISVRLEPSTDGRAAELTVRDTGSGIPPNELPQLFERFHRVQGARSRTHEGTGIGLALVKELAKQHGGQVSVESAPERGSAFTVRIPFGSAHLPAGRVKAAATLASTATKAEAFIEEAHRWLPDNLSSTEFVAPDWESSALREPGEKRARVLLVDDNADMRGYLKRLLIPHYDVMPAANGQEALDRISVAPPDLVLSDIMMPVLDGLGMLDAIRADPATNTLPVILLSARAGEEARVQGLAARADDYLVKPFTARELLARVEVHLSLAHMRKQEAQRVRETIEAELKGMTRLHEVASRLLAAPDLRSALEEMLVATCTMMNSRMGNVQVHDPRDQTLTIGAHLGFSQDFLDRFAIVKRDTPSACGPAINSGSRVIIEDVDQDESFRHLRDIAAAAGFRSLQSTPLLGRTGALLGVLSTYWSEPHRPSERDLYMLDLYAREAADILERIQTADELQRSLDRLRTLSLENARFYSDLQRSEAYLAQGQSISHTGSFGWSLPSGEIYWSEETYNIFEYDPAVKPTLELALRRTHPDDTDLVQQTLDRAAQAGENFDLEHRLLMPDGAVKHVHSLAHALKTSSGNLEFVGAITDVTAAKQAEEKIRQSERELRQLLDVAPQQVAVLGPDYSRIYVNQAALDYFGLTLEEGLSLDRRGFFHPDDWERMASEVQSKFLRGIPHEAEFRLRRKDGKYRWFLFRYNPLRDEQGRLTRWYAAGTDIEDRKQAEQRLQSENVALREEIDKASMFEEIVGASPPLQRVLSRISRVAPTDSSILITGETGTGKELVARAIHRRSRRSSRAFVSVNCAAVPQDLIASELFGHEKGAFTGATQRRLGRFELAEGGTIFLDEIGELSAETQIALLRVLQEHEFERVGGVGSIRTDVRVIAATNRDLQAAIAAGMFRSDLFYRLNVFPIEMPPLRERREDIPLLVEYFIDRFARKSGKTFQAVNKKSLDLLQSYPWPGNIRELQNVIERSSIVSSGDIFSVDESWLSKESSQSSPQVQVSPPMPGESRGEREIIEAALAESRGRIAGPSGAAAKLRIPPSTLEYKIKVLKIRKSQFKFG
jgi:PAS domain S-box-containing protein